MRLVSKVVSLSVGVILLAALTIYLVTGYAERRRLKDDLAMLAALRDETQAREVLGEPSLVESAPVVGLYAPPNHCDSAKIARALVFHRGHGRKASFLLYVGSNGDLICVDARRFYVVGH